MKLPGLSRFVTLVEIIASNKAAALLVVFVLSFAFNIILINTVETKKLAPDGKVYHTLAVNLAYGHGLSICETAPFEKYYFREPGYPVFLASCYKVYQYFGGHSSYLGRYDYETMDYDYANHPEIRFAKYIQAFISAAGVVVFFLLISLLLNSTASFVIAFLFALYYPVAIHSAYLLRENLQLLVILLMSYFFAAFLLKKKGWQLLVFSVFWALSNLLLQVTTVLPVFIFLFAWIYSKKLKMAVVTTVASSLFMILCISPWLIHIYHYYPDLRIIKSSGTSYTLEMKKYIGAVDKLVYNHSLSLEEGLTRIHTACNIPANRQFDNSFRGKYGSFADSVNRLKLKSVELKMILKNTVRNFQKSWFNTKISTLGTKAFIKQNFLVNGTLLLIPVLLALFAFIGMFFYFRKLFPVLLLFVTFLCLFYLIGDEYRRMLPAQPFIFLFGILGICYVFKGFVKRNGIMQPLFKETQINQS